MQRYFAHKISAMGFTAACVRTIMVIYIVAWLYLISYVMRSDLYNNQNDYNTSAK